MVIIIRSETVLERIKRFRNRYGNGYETVSKPFHTLKNSVLSQNEWDLFLDEHRVGGKLTKTGIFAFNKTVQINGSAIVVGLRFY